jgi:hypothetical protein
MMHNTNMLVLLPLLINHRPKQDKATNAYEPCIDCTGAVGRMLRSLEESIYMSVYLYACNLCLVSDE